jgi:chromatin segregation and condensation protein Rec8/ScpA/Scc1 (kleisin family)
MKVLHGTWSCLLSIINKGKIKVIDIPLCKGIANMHWL